MFCDKTYICSYSIGLSLYRRIIILSRPKINYISSAVSSPCVTSIIIRTARINPSLKAPSSVIPHNSLWQSLNLSKTSFCFSMKLALSSSSSLQISLTSVSSLVPRLTYLSCGLMFPYCFSCFFDMYCCDNSDRNNTVN